MKGYSLNLGGRLLDLSEPAVMAVVNVTPDSFYTSFGSDSMAMLDAVGGMLADGAAIIDVGACSTRPGAEFADEQQETARLMPALEAIRGRFPDAAVSVDTFRASVARMAVERFGVQMINDISGGSEEMYGTVAEMGAAYVLTHNEPENVSENQGEADYLAGVLRFLEQRVARLTELGVHDVVVDPGFGFGKTLEQNYMLLRNLDLLHELDCPVLAGVSHKSMLTRLLGITAEDAHHATTAANTIALMNGADIVRVHDVKHAVEARKIVMAAKGE